LSDEEFWKKYNLREMRMAELGKPDKNGATDSDLSATVGSPRVILSYKNVEGTHLVKANGRYYLFNAVPHKDWCVQGQITYGDLMVKL